MLNRLARAPIVHFVAIGAALFALGRAGRARDPASYRIVVSAGQVDNLIATFMRSWQRPPTLQELRGLLDAHVEQEIFYREAIALGLDRDDMLIRRRLAQKLEFVAADATQGDTPAEAQRKLYQRLRSRYAVVVERAPRKRAQAEAAGVPP